MATAAFVLDNHSYKSPGTSKFSHEDDQILQQPYAENLSKEWGYSQEEIINAVRSLQEKEKSLKVESLESIKVIMEIDELRNKRLSAPPSMEIDELRNKRLNAPPSQVKNLPRNEDIGSDGESDGASLEYFDANPDPAASIDDELQTDAEPSAMTLQLPELEVLSPKAVQKKKPIIDAHSPKEATALSRKLLALRSENRRLKERQLCKGCRTRPVSITFLPCGHYSYCYDCGQRFSACPICRKTILADVRTFLA